MVNNGHWPLGPMRQPRRRRRALGWAGGSPPAPGPAAPRLKGSRGGGSGEWRPERQRRAPLLCLGRHRGPARAPWPRASQPRFLPAPSLPSVAQRGSEARVPRRPRSPRWGPRRQPHLHARGTGVDPRVQDGDEHPLARHTPGSGTGRRRGPGLLLREEAAGKGSLGRCGGHGRRLQGGGEANGPGCARTSGGARTTPGGRGPGLGGGADGCRASLPANSRAAKEDRLTAPLRQSRRRRSPEAEPERHRGRREGAEPEAWPEGLGPEPSRGGGP